MSGTKGVRKDWEARVHTPTLTWTADQLYLLIWVQVYRCTGVQLYRCTGLFDYWLVSVQVNRYKFVQAYMNAGVKLYRCTGMQV